MHGTPQRPVSSIAHIKYRPQKVYLWLGLHLQNSTSVVQPVSSAQWATNAPPVVLPRVAVAAPTPNYPQTNSWSAANSIVMPSHHQQQGSVIIDSQQAVGSQDSSGQFRFLPGQRSSQDSQSTPSLSNRSVPRFLEEAWARGEPQQQGARQAPSMPPPPPPPPPGTDLGNAAGALASQQLLILTLQNNRLET